MSQNPPAIWIFDISRRRNYFPSILDIKRSWISRRSGEWVWAWQVCCLEDFNLNIEYWGDSQLHRLQPRVGPALDQQDPRRAPAQPGVQPGLQLLQDDPQLQQEDDLTKPPGALISGPDIAQVGAGGSLQPAACRDIQLKLFYFTGNHFF